MVDTTQQLWLEHHESLLSHVNLAFERAIKNPPALMMPTTARQKLLLNSHDISLYVHYPFCVHKCPYCDFASLSLGADEGRDRLYIDLLSKEFELKKDLLLGRKLVSLYIGGGTPSLCSPKELGRLLEAVGPYLAEGAEISLEANPGTIDLNRLKDLRAVGFNRISIGVQSFNDQALKRLGRIHDSNEAIAACKNAVLAGFENYNLDIMHGLPKQDAALALSDLKTALEMESTHLSWYELTLEEGTLFGDKPPKLPDEEVLFAIEQEGFELLDKAGFEHYEVSGYNLKGEFRCLHNQNYWLYGDYLGIGAAAHQKVTLLNPKLSALLSSSSTTSSQSDLSPAKLFSDANLLSNFAYQLAAHESDSSENEQACYEISRSVNPEDYKQYMDLCLKSSGELNIDCDLVSNVKSSNDASLVDAQETMAETLDSEVKGSGVLAYTTVEGEEIPFEFMLNRLRLFDDKITSKEYLLHTGMPLKKLEKQLSAMASRGLIELDPDLSFKLTSEGKIMLNDAIAEFL